VHPQGFGPLYFGDRERPLNRFDVPAGVIYLAMSTKGAFLEAVLRDQGLGDNVRLLSEAFVRTRCLSRIEFGRPLRLVDVSDSGAAKLGVDLRVATGGDYRLSQAWSSALWAHPQRPDGLRYASRHDGSERCAAVFHSRSGSGPTTKNAEPHACIRHAYLGTFLDPGHAALLEEFEVGLVP
jgi:hypothetical protein